MREWVLEDLEDRRRQTPLEDLRDVALEMEPGPSFLASLAESPGIIAEIKRATPSAGAFDESIQVEERCRLYQEAGAVGLSVHTQARGFLGSGEDLLKARRIVDLPILRNDFILDEYQLFESRAWGADAVLLIVSFLEGPRLQELFYQAAEIGLETLVEVHHDLELEVALEMGADWVGVNTRDLATLTVDPGVHEHLSTAIPEDVIATAESGIESVGRIRRLRDLGYRGFLVGTALTARPRPGEFLRDLVEAAVTP